MASSTPVTKHLGKTLAVWTPEDKAFWQQQGKANVILAPAACPAGHLVKFGGIQGHKPGSVETVRI